MWTGKPEREGVASIHQNNTPARTRLFAGTGAGVGAILRDRRYCAGTLRNSSGFSARSVKRSSATEPLNQFT